VFGLFAEETCFFALRPVLENVEYFEGRMWPSVMFTAEMCERSVGPSSAIQNNRQPKM
jgi:hypothetical protein